MIEDHQLPAGRIDHRDPRLPTHQQGTEVVPGSVRVGRAVDEAVQSAVGYRTEVQGHRSQRPELPPSEVPRRKAGETDDRVAEVGAPTGGQHPAVHRGAETTHGLVGTARDEVPHQGDDGAITVNGTEAGGVPGNPARGVGGPVQGVHHHDDGGSEIVLAGLLAQDPDAGGVEHGVGGGVGDEVAAVLADPPAGRAPVPEWSQRRGHRIRGLPQQSPQLVLTHAHSHVRIVTPPWQARDVAAIDVAGFIADLKDHAVDHGFHVHDERHFVESYSLRQAWEVDLHPEEACGGPLDLHLSLEVDPRVLLSFEDKVLELPETDEPPDEFHFPMLFTWALPPLPMGPDLLVLATELAGVGGPDLPLEVSAIDSFAAVTDAPERSLAIVARIEVSLAKVFLGQELLCEVLDRCLAVSQYLLDRAPVWLDEV